MTKSESYLKNQLARSSQGRGNWLMPKRRNICVLNFFICLNKLDKFTSSSILNQDPSESIAQIHCWKPEKLPVASPLDDDATCCKTNSNPFNDRPEEIAYLHIMQITNILMQNRASMRKILTQKIPLLLLASVGDPFVAVDEPFTSFPLPFFTMQIQEELSFWKRCIWLCKSAHKKFASTSNRHHRHRIIEHEDPSMLI